MGIFDGKAAIITGGGKAKSIGYGIAVAYAKEGCNLTLTGRNEGKLLAAKEELEGLYGVRVLPLVADVTPDDDAEERVNQVVTQTADSFGRIDVLINNAQASASGIPLAMQSKDHFDLGVYSGLYATFYYMRACYPHLKKTQGSVINFASGAGLFGNAGQSSYAAAKEGIRGISRVAATEWGPDNINVNVVCPLAMTSQLENFKLSYPEAYEKNLKAVPMGRFGDPERDIGRVCVLLGSPDFKYMSGETLTLEGGMGQRP
jgi:NAD(P)-dependent dehydrogenase (short-subunit alcohol dehydrogenase family)